MLRSLHLRDNLAAKLVSKLHVVRGGEEILSLIFYLSQEVVVECVEGGVGSVKASPPLRL